MFQRLMCVFAVLAAATLTSAAGPILYTVSWGPTTMTLKSFDASNIPSPTIIGPLGVLADFGALAYDTNNNTMYLVDGGGNNSTKSHISTLYSLNLTTGAATVIGSTGLVEVTGLTYDSANNTLYGTQFGFLSGTPLEILNITTGAATPVGPSIASGRFDNSVDNLAYDSTNGVLYGYEDGSFAALYSINTVTGVGTLLSGSGLISNDSGIVYDPVTNLLWDLDVASNLTTIDPLTHVQTSVGTTFNLHETSGLALIPGPGVPEPSTIALIGSGMAILFARRGRKAR